MRLSSKAKLPFVVGAVFSRHRRKAGVGRAYAFDLHDDAGDPDY